MKQLNDSQKNLQQQRQRETTPHTIVNIIAGTLQV